MLELRPRHYAADIIKLRTREERNAALLKVPEALRELTKAHVVDYFSRLRAQ